MKQYPEHFLISRKISLYFRINCDLINQFTSSLSLSFYWRLKQRFVWKNSFSNKFTFGFFSGTIWNKTSFTPTRMRADKVQERDSDGIQCDRKANGKFAISRDEIKPDSKAVSICSFVSRYVIYFPFSFAVSSRRQFFGSFFPHPNVEWMLSSENSVKRVWDFVWIALWFSIDKFSSIYCRFHSAGCRKSEKQRKESKKNVEIDSSACKAVDKIALLDLRFGWMCFSFCLS